MASQVEICNLALSHLGQADEIANLVTERSAAAAACRRFYDVARDATLRDFSWPFATKFAFLNLVEEDPTEEWAFSYRFPVDCLLARRIVSGFRIDTALSRVVYKIGRDTAGQLIYTDKVDPQLEYTMKVTDPDKYNAQFVLALSYRLAMYIVPKINNGDPFKISQNLMSFYRLELASAQRSAYVEEQPDNDPPSQFISARL